MKRLRFLSFSFSISIHVPLAGDDMMALSLSSKFKQISIHVPLAGDDSMSNV